MQLFTEHIHLLNNMSKLKLSLYFLYIVIEKTVQCHKNVLVCLEHCYIALKSNLNAPHLGEGRLLLLKEILLLLEHASSLGENCNIQHTDGLY